MILINKFEPILVVNPIYHQCIDENIALDKIYEFIDLPESIKSLEQINSAILRNYYSNALQNNLIDIKTVKNQISKKLKATNLDEKSIEIYQLAEKFLDENLDEPLSLNLFNELLQFLRSNEDNGIFLIENSKKQFELSEIELHELENFFHYVNTCNDYHPSIMGWMIHFKVLSFLFKDEKKSLTANLIHWFWLRKHKLDVHGLLCLQHEIYLNRATYEKLAASNSSYGDENLNLQVSFGMLIQQAQNKRLKDLFRSYFKKQIDFEKLNPRQKNIMNFVFERGYRLKDIDDSILNKRQKLIMYIVQHKGFISTKDLVGEFDCNRKTIQRDFQLLLDIGLVKAIGAGAGLKYCVNLIEASNPALEKYQASFVNKDSDN